MMISTKGRYALRIMVDLAQHKEEGFISLKIISERQEISLKYLEAIIGILNRANFVKSMRGKSGGYKLQRESKEYNIGSILRLTEGGLVPVNCSNCTPEHSCARGDECLSYPLWENLDRLVNDYLDSVSLEDIVEGRLVDKDIVIKFVDR
ncbi:MAG: Rrf2 family transcriptional regulator [Spirochaetaceae bacterium]|nr:Rrf2 family transcriptional regulator [Spirochaetaceae bacterium]